MLVSCRDESSIFLLQWKFQTYTSSANVRSAPNTATEIMIALSSPDSDLVKLVEEGGIDSLREGLALGCPVGLLGYDDGCDDGSDDGCPLG